MRSFVSVAAIAMLTFASTSHAALLEEFEDDCSVSVWIKRPYADDTQIATGDILLARKFEGNDPCQLLESSGSSLGGHDGTCQTNASQNSAWTSWFSYSSLRNPSTRRFRWVCGDDLERSRCPVGTKRVRFRLLKDSDEFRTQCSSNPA